MFLLSCWLSAFHILVCGVLFSLSVTIVYAKDIYTHKGFDTARDDMAIGVRERPKPDYDPLGLRIGSFLLYPSVRAGIEYDTNIFALSSSEVTDIIYLIDPQVVLKSEWSRHRLELDFIANHREYQDNTQETFTNYQGLASTTLDVTRDFKIDSSFFGGLLHEERGAADSPTSASEPTPFLRMEAKLSINKTFNRLTSSFGASYVELDYDDVSALNGGIIDQDNRDGEILTIVNRNSYEFSPGYRAFVFGEYNTRDFVGNPGLNRDSEGYRVLGGVEFEVSRLLTGEIGLGYLSQNYSEADFEDINGFTYRSGITWHPTTLMTIKINGERSVAETVVVGASGRLDTTAGVTIDYELLRNLIVSPNFNYQFSDFKGVTRDDTNINGGINIDYLLGRQFHFGMTYNYLERESSAPDLDYERQKVGAHVKAQF